MNVCNVENLSQCLITLNNIKWPTQDRNSWHALLMGSPYLGQVTWKITWRLIARRNPMVVFNVESLFLCQVALKNTNWPTLGRKPLCPLLVKSISPSQVTWRDTCKHTQVRSHLYACSVTKFSLKLSTSRIIFGITPGRSPISAFIVRSPSLSQVREGF